MGSLIEPDGITDTTGQQISQSIQFGFDVLQSSLGFRITLSSGFPVSVLPVSIKLDRFIDRLTLSKLFPERG
ncbi:MAG TPA: hypothetical protein VMU18_00115 [Rhodoblastus sp.]|nr:hypothetical protein [Rhodoblastus sp.]